MPKTTINAVGVIDESTILKNMPISAKASLGSTDKFFMYT